MLISSRQFYCVLVITSWVINIHLVLRDISNISFPPTPRRESVFSCRQVTFSDVYAAADSLRLLYTSENTHFLTVPWKYRVKQWCFSIKISTQIWMSYGILMKDSILMWVVFHTFAYIFSKHGQMMRIHSFPCRGGSRVLLYVTNVNECKCILLLKI